MRTNANSTLGNAASASLTLISISSSQPPKYPVTAPKITPMISPDQNGSQGNDQ